MNRRVYPIATIDFETDPFKEGRMPQPFAAGFYDGHTYAPFWGPDCVERLVEFLKAQPRPLCIYAHNGGKFDFFYLLKHCHSELRMINARIVTAYLDKHELRDSYAAVPIPLRKFKKDDIDIAKLERSRRNKHKLEILSYLRGDCVYLHQLMSEFRKEFGDKLTIAGAASAELKKFHAHERGGERFDARFRPFYAGGRNQCFRAGVIDQPVRIYDVNSMYPKVMRDYLHPVDVGYGLNNKITPRTCFLVVSGVNRGAFWTRDRNGSLTFTDETGTFDPVYQANVFHVSIHEFIAALDTGTFDVERIHRTFEFDHQITFDEFVDHFYPRRLRARDTGDKLHEIFYKLILNSAYGRFAINPRRFHDWQITPYGAQPCEPCVFCDEDTIDACEKCNGTGLRWALGAEDCDHEYSIWKARIQREHFQNVATAASITGAARAVLLRGLAKASRPLYCDTDSIICESLDVEVHDSTLGAWKLEGEGTRAAIAGKKLYAIFDGAGNCIKKAHKGAKLEGKQLLMIAQGHTIEAPNPVPQFKLTGSHLFAKPRRIRPTAKTHHATA